MFQGAAMFDATFEHDLHAHKGIYIGRDASLIRVGEGIYDILHRRFAIAIHFDNDGGYWFDPVDDRPISLYEVLGDDPYEFYITGRGDAETIISTLRGPVFRAVKRLQRAFREKREKRYMRYMQRYDENEGWVDFIDCVVAWVESRGRYFRKSKFSPFSPTPTWGYAPASAIAGAPSWAARDPADVDAEPAGAESDIGVQRRSRSRSRSRNSSEAESGAGVAGATSWDNLTEEQTVLTEAELR